MRVVQPQKGEQAQLVEMCRNNAAERIARKSGMAGRDARRAGRAGPAAGPPRTARIYRKLIFPIPAAATTSPVWWCLKTESP